VGRVDEGVASETQALIIRIESHHREWEELMREWHQRLKRCRIDAHHREREELRTEIHHDGAVHFSFL
jgi:hypothetical protein